MDSEQILAFLRRAGDAQIRDAVHAFGTEEVLGLIFTGMAARFGLREGRAPGLLVFELDDDGTEHRHGVAVSDGGARHWTDPTEQARASIRTSVVRFCRVAVGSQDPKRLVATGRLRIGGDLVWAVATLASLRK